MEIGIIGLGRMGANIARRLLRAGHGVVAFDQQPDAVGALAKDGARPASTIQNVVELLAPPRGVWVMVPSGEPTERTLAELAGALQSGDTVIDGGNSYYRDSIRRAATLKARGISFLDAGTSGGIWGLKEGYCLMVGGDAAVYRRYEPIFQALAPSPERGLGHVGPSGAGHFVKMIHNGIEYGLMQAYAEGFQILKAKSTFELDLAQIAEMWRHGSVVRSWLLDLTAEALREDPELSNIKAYVEDSGEGRWTVVEAVDLAVPAPVISLALQARFRSRQEQPFGVKLLAAMRNKFGGHAVRKAD